jgi:hypothetical protein
LAGILPAQINPAKRPAPTPAGGGSAGAMSEFVGALGYLPDRN